MKRLISLLIAALMALSLGTACQIAGEPGQTMEPMPTEEPANQQEYDENAVVAKIGETDTVTLGEMKNVFDMYLEYFSYYGYDVTSDAATLESFQDDIVNMLVQEKLVGYKARQLGMAEYTAEQRAELDRRIQQDLDGLDEHYRAQAKEEAASDASVDVDARTMELILEEAIATLGDENATYEMYKEELAANVESAYLAELLKEQMLKDVKPSDEDINEEYNTALAADTEAYTSAPENYKGDQEGYEVSGEGMPVLFVPEGYSRVMDIYIPFEGEMPAECTAKKAEMDTLKAEYSELTFADALAGTNANASRLSEILTQYKTLSEEYNTLYAGYSAAAYETINAVYARLQNGEAFADVMAETTQNADFTEIDAYADKGMLIAPALNSAADWSEAFKAQFAKLSLGQYSPVFEDENGLRVIYYAADETPGAKPVEEVRAELEAYLETVLEEEEWTALLTEWTNEEGAVELFPEVFRSLGTTAGSGE